MAHEIEKDKDNVVLRETEAWHSLGKIFTGDMSLVEALPEFGGDWEVDQWDLVAVCRRTGRLRSVDTHVLNVRHDTDDQLSVVGVDWRVIQNRTTAEFAQALAKDGDTVKIETGPTHVCWPAVFQTPTVNRTVRYYSSGTRSSAAVG